MSWSTIKTPGIVLTSIPWREADRRYRILTPNFGKIDCLGRGARRGKAKLAAHLEPFAMVELECVRGKSGTTVIGVERTRSYRAIYTDLERRLLASAALTLVDWTTREDDQDPIVFDEVESFMDFLDGPDEIRPLRGTYILGSFLLKLLGHTGYDLELGRCVGCRESILPLAFRWSDERGGLVCTDCVASSGRDWELSRPMREETVKLLRYGRSSDYDALLRPPLSGADMEEFSRAVHAIAAGHVPGDWLTPFWRAVVPVPA